MTAKVRKCVRCGAAVPNRRALVPKHCPNCGQRMDAYEGWQTKRLPIRRAPGALASLILGIFSLCAPPIGILFGVFAIGIGLGARKEVKVDPLRYNGEGYAMAGIALGCAGCLFSLMVCASL